MNEREKFEAWQAECLKGNYDKNSPWEAWKARALLDDPTALDCPACDGTGDGDTSGDPQNSFFCPECRGDRVASWV
jgi:hypothetical protein